MTALDALLGTISEDGVELELGNGLNFMGACVNVARNTVSGKIDIEIAGAIGHGEVRTVNVPADYATLTEAVEAIGDWLIPATSFVDIVVAAGHYAAVDTATVWRQPCGERVRIKGADYLQSSISSLQSVSGAAGAYSVAINVSSTAGAAVGDYALVAARGGTGPWQIHSGCWEITAINSSTRLTVKNTARNAAFPSTTLTSGSVNVLRTVLTYNGCDGIRAEGSKLGLLINVAIIGDGTGDFSGINCAGHDGVGGSDIIASKMSGTGSIVCGEFVGVNGFGANGIVSNHGSSVFANSAACCNNGKYGFYAAVASAIEAREGCGNGNEEGGVIADYGGTAWVAGAHLCGNGANGIFVFNGGHVVANEVACDANAAWGADVRFGDATIEIASCGYNGQGGALCQNGSRLAFDGSTASNNTGPGVEVLRGGTIRGEDLIAENNTTYGIKAGAGGFIYAPNATLSGNTTSNRRLDPGGTIEDENGTDWNKALVHATVSADQTISINTETLLDFDTQQVDASGEFDAGTSIYTASVVKSQRRLRVTVAVDMTYGAADVYELRLKKNGAVVSTTIYTAPTGSGRASLMLTDVVEVVPGDTLAAYIFQNGGSRTVRSGATLTRLLIEEI